MALGWGRFPPPTALVSEAPAAGGPSKDGPASTKAGSCSGDPTAAGLAPVRVYCGTFPPPFEAPFIVSLSNEGRLGTGSLVASAMPA